MQHPNISISQPIVELLNLMERLRDPDQGCTWDKKQTWQTILPHTIEEVYEVADAVDRHDASALRDELGDLLFQIVNNPHIAKEQNLFDFNDVVQSVTQKMIRRHPHVFGDVTYQNEREQKQAWESIKHAERTEETTTPASSFFTGIPQALPALRRSQKLQQRAARVGFDWDNWQQVIPKVHEELDEIQEAVLQGESPQRIEEEVGDVIMATTNLARMLGVNAENALRVANNKFERRFLRVESLLQTQGITLEQASLEHMENAWIIAKQEEKQTNGS